MCPSGSTGGRRREGVAAAADSKSAWTEYREAFEVLDADHDGKISKEDLHKFYQDQFSTNGFDLEIIGTMMSVADSNKDGFVEYDEFQRVLNRKMFPQQQEEEEANSILKDVFEVMDKDGDGFLSHEDLKTYMNSAGFSADDQDISAMINLAATAGDCRQGVSFEGLLKILAISPY
ncbi:hypothetical protein ACFE04_012311 [Oxalis oulophora]